MRLILEIIDHDGDRGVQRVVDDFPTTVGRGYHNDIILPDPHVGESHMSINCNDGVWMITDLGSVNPTLLNAQPVHGSAAVISSGDMLRLGMTTVRVFSSSHAVPPPIQMQKASGALLFLSRSRNVWACLIAAALAMMAWAYVAVWTSKTILTLCATASGTVIAILIWAALWSMAGKFIRRRAYFKEHVALASLVGVLDVLIWFATSIIAFLMSESEVAAWIGILMNSMVLTFLIYGCLSLSTLMKKKKCVQSALFFSIGLIFGVFGVERVAHEEFTPEVLYPYRLMPYLSNLATADTPDSFLARSEKLFKSDTFVRPIKNDNGRL